MELELHDSGPAAATLASLPSFDIVVPLAFAHGRAASSVAAWIAQTYASNRSRVVVVAPNDHPAGELASVGAQLRPQDRLLNGPYQHDMDLLAAGAAACDSDIVILTEGHCRPDPNFLAASAAILAEHPEWAGFSGRSIAETPNLLAELASAFYGRHIEENLYHHPWRKVLDQCFVVRREAYEAVGGIETQYGHFAETVLAARLHRAGLRIGYDQRAVVHHAYLTELSELTEFAADFGRGEMRYAAVADHDPCGDLIDDPPVWRRRHEADLEAAQTIVQMLHSDASHRHAKRRIARLATLVRWRARAAMPAGTQLATAQLRLATLATRLRCALALRRRTAAAHLLARLNDAARDLGAMQWLASSEGKQAAGWHVPQHASEWKAAVREPVPTLGGHELERELRPFRWFAPEALIAIPISGEMEVRIEWAPSGAGGHCATRFYVDGYPLDPALVVHGQFATRLRLVAPSKSTIRLGWISPRIRAPNDNRRLGLSVHRITWSSVNLRTGSRAPSLARDNRRRPSQASGDPFAPIYFLHVQKTAGISLRSIVNLAFHADDSLFPLLRVYWARQFDQEAIPALGCVVAAGHFGWDLPTAAPDRRWRILTVLREPFDRLLSLHGYRLQMASLPEGSRFEAWVEDGLLARDTAVAHFVPGGLTTPPAALSQATAQTAAWCASALRHLAACEVVGLHERLPDTVNLFCNAIGALPPATLPHLNRTLVRSAERDPALMAGLEPLLRADHALYAAACMRFEQDLAALHAMLAEPGDAGPIDTAQATARLRRRWFARHAAIDPLEPCRPWMWLAGDAFPGHGLHDLEEHAGRRLHWTAPGGTAVHAELNSRQLWRLRLFLHPATPGDHVAALTVRVNGLDLSLSIEQDDDGPIVESSVFIAAPPAETSPFSALELRSPHRRGTAEFRELGIALEAIVLEPAIAGARTAG